MLDQQARVWGGKTVEINAVWVSSRLNSAKSVEFNYDHKINEPKNSTTERCSIWVKIAGLLRSLSLTSTYRYSY